MRTSAPSALITADIGRFRAALPQGGRLLGLDSGTKRIGVATCDAGWHFANAAATLPRDKMAQVIAALRTHVEQNGLVGIVLGLPRNMDGSEGPRAQAARSFARNLAPLGLPILLWDERWSTAAVERQMIAADLSRAKRAERIDSAAAAYILQGAIDALAGMHKAD